MRIAFTAGETGAEFRRSAMTARSELRVGDEIVPLQSPFRVTAHFDIRTRTVWRRSVGDHEVEVARSRPRLFGGLRRSSYTVAVDGVIVADAIGR